MSPEELTNKKYSDTVILPKTDFPMRANLSAKEPRILEEWKKQRIYYGIQEKNKGGDMFVLHDGPPFTNGHIHVGHSLCYSLKDMVLKSRNMMGFSTPFIPGSDCHGLPIEHKIAKSLLEEGKVDIQPLELRRRCAAYAAKYIDVQQAELQRLGLFAEWENPYITMAPAYEAEVLRCFAKIVENGHVYEAMRPVLWSTGCKTALAEAEVEYQDRADTTVHVLFRVLSSPEWPGGALDGAHLLLWTTTPWTLPSNLAAAVNPDIPYVIAENNGRKFILAKSRLAEAGLGGEDTLIREEFPGSALVGLKYSHPFLERTGSIYAADFVTHDSGTGIVHIAPGHGMDDFLLGHKHGLPVLSPVDDNGRFTAECGVPQLTGKYVFDANADVLEIL
ncbi:MAG: class I tRNA ligase family protein, partial [Elusimicrobia bacterium]|nr:class I tRNA ligase family protein [Elusimicrobiota bacterium]